MIQIDYDKCTGCGLCVKDCLMSELSVVEGRLEPANKLCNVCGHCLAICPQNAIAIIGGDEQDVLEYDPETFSVKTENLLNFIRFRRTVRNYKRQKLERETLENILKAGIFSPTGMNAQSARFIVVDQELPKLTELGIDTLNDMAEDVLADEKSNKALKNYARMWKQIYKSYHEDGIDRLFYQPSAVIAAVANERFNKMTAGIDCAIACENMQLVADSMGLGSCYIGFLTRAEQHNPEITEFLGIKPHERLITSFSVGYPDVKYHRTVTRKKDKVTWR